MKFIPTPLRDVYVLKPEPVGDYRGSFSRVFCRDEFRAHGLEFEVAQANSCYSRHVGTVRGMHFQKPPAEENKLVSVVRGAVFDVAVDLETGSWFGVELSAANGWMLYVPIGYAHGYQTLTDDSEVRYLVSSPYAPHLESGVRWNDPAIGIDWPFPEATAISEKDRNYPDSTFAAKVEGEEHV